MTNINKQNQVLKFNNKNKFFEKIKLSFKLTTHKITLISIFLALTTVVSLLEIPTFFLPFLPIDFGNTINLLAVYVIGWPYAFLIAIVSPWLRLFLPTTTGGSGGVVGQLSYMLGTVTILITFFSVISCLSLITVTKKYQWINTINMIIAAMIACFLTSLLNTFYNYAFILDLYHAANYKTILWKIFFPFNLFKFTLVLGLFLMIHRPFILVKNSYHL